ncbi:UNVERIFIED_CONTAM: hypothetical protein Sradi_6936100 [Sesamum radiatum]|uniref:DDE Tnp4 domain-containing protein n=1 Tax=Sesamum radiatum TaxID=300843 RepID=A0AAW2JG62_SESRA
MTSYVAAELLGCLGALDGTHIDVRVPDSEKGRCHNRKSYTSINVLGVCNTEGLFTYVLSGWDGTADGQVLRHAISRSIGLKVPSENYYLCDNGYANREGFLTPYRGLRYHLKEWERGGGGPQNARELFNLHHAAAQNVIECSFGLLKTRWGILRCPHTTRLMCKAVLLLLVAYYTITYMNPTEQEGISNPRRYRKKIDKTIIRRTWTQREEEALVNALRTICCTGWRCENGFRARYKLEALMLKQFPNSDIRAEPHINSKIHVWKKFYNTLVDTTARTMRFKSWPFFPAWCEIFGRDRAEAEWFPETGYVRNDGAALDEIQLTQEPNVQSTAAMRKSTSSSKKRKVIGLSNIVSTFCESANERLGELSKKLFFDFIEGEKRAAIYEAVGQVPGINMNDQIGWLKIPKRWTSFSAYLTRPELERLG